MSRNTYQISSLVFITGLAGAGKSTVLDVFSDSGFFVIDNLPTPLLGTFLEFSKTAPKKYSRTALLLNIDSIEKVEDALKIVDELQTMGLPPFVIFLDCSNETIIKRYSETRRPHPGFDPTQDRTIEDAIVRERQILQPLKERANLLLDTSSFNCHDLKRSVRGFVNTIELDSSRKVRINFVSFGFKYGVPLDCDLLVDVRFLPNPYFVEELRLRNGLDETVRNYVLSNEQAKLFVEKYQDLLKFLIPHYIYEGKSYINIGIGCTGGKHRSVTIAEYLSELISGSDLVVSVKHSDILKERPATTSRTPLPKSDQKHS